MNQLLFCKASKIAFEKKSIPTALSECKVISNFWKMEICFLKLIHDIGAFF